MSEVVTKTVCPYCGVGCGLVVKARDGRITEVRGDKEHPSTLGGICPKGAQIGEIVNTPNRLTTALWREARDQVLAPVPLDDALDRLADRYRELLRVHGPDAVAFYVSGQLTTEAQYVFNKLAKGAIGTNNIDANSRLCMASAVSAYKLAFGADTPPACYEDIDLADCFLIVGANMAECHPVLWQRLKRRASRKRVRVIVVDPRRTPTAEAADLHLAIRPGTDVPLLNAILNLVISQGGLNRSFIERHTTGWEAVQAAAETWPPERAARVCGIDEQDLRRAAVWFAQSAETLSLWAMGANQSTSGVAKNLALINLHLATGKLSRPGSGPFSLTGQPNAMGGREVGYMSSLLPGHRDVRETTHREAIARIWGVRPGKLQPEPGLDAVRMFAAAAEGRVKALWIAGCNPLGTLPDAERVRSALAKVELLVVQDCYHPTETSRFAHAVLPAAMSVEGAGTMTNSERRVSLLQPCVPPPGEARPDWEIVCRFAARLGHGPLFSFDSAADIFEEHKRCCADVYQIQMNGLSHRRLRRQAVQWPCPSSASPGVARCFRRKIFATPDGRARFHPTDYRPPADELTPEFPLVLNTGRIASQWHSRTKTGHVAKLNRAEPGPFVVAHPADATALGLVDGDAVRIASRRGVAQTTLRVNDTVRPGDLFMPFHWCQSHHEDGCVNAVTQPAGDPISLQSELKFAAVRLEKVS